MVVMLLRGAYNLQLNINEMNRYAHYRVMLLIGLFSLQTLSSCIHTRQELDIDTPIRKEQSGKALSKQAQNRASKSQVGSVWPALGLGCMITGGATVGMFVLVQLVNHLMINPFNIPLDTNINVLMRDSSVTTDASLIPTAWHTTDAMSSTRLDDTTETFIMRGINKGKNKWDEEQWGGNVTNSLTGRIKDPMVLDHLVMYDMLDNNFSETRIQYWLDQGLNIEARDPGGRTLLMWAADKGIERAVQFLIDHGATVNAQDNDGSTVLHYLLGHHDWSVHNSPIIDILVRHGVDPFIENKDGKPSMREDRKSVV